MGWYAADGSPAPPEAVAQFVRKEMRRAGIKPAGRRKAAPGTTKGEKRMGWVKDGHKPERIAEKVGIEPESVKRSIRRAKQRMQEQG
jgi:hypothetical protein